MSHPKISIVIPSFNKEKYIGTTLDSIFSQEYENFEVIIMDGGSTDRSVGIIERYAKNHKDKITWQSKIDKGQLDAVNTGLESADGDIVTFINADDCYEKGAFESVVGHFLENPEALWFAGRGIIINDKNREIARPVTWYKNFLLRRNSKPYLLMTNYLIQSSIFLTRKSYQKYGPFTGTNDFITEYEFWLKLSQIQMPVVINKVLSKFRIEKSTKTKRLFKSLLLEDERIINKFTNNKLVLFAHKLHNLGRVFIEKFV